MSELTSFIDLMRMGAVASIVTFLATMANMIMLVVVLSRLPATTPPPPPQWQVWSYGPAPVQPAQDETRRAA